MFGYSLLLRRQNGLGFDSESCKWFQEYVSQRQQCVFFFLGNYCSMYLTLSKGVQQGSILGHLLTTIYSKSTILHLPCSVHLHADDTLRCCSANTAHSAIQTLRLDQLQRAQSILKDLFSKTKYLLFSRVQLKTIVVYILPL